MSNYDPNRHHRRSIRLKGYDYRQEGVYCVTICTHGRECLFGRVRESGEMALSEYGAMVAVCWANIPTHFPQVELDAFVVMTNHVHGIVVITENISKRSSKTNKNTIIADDANGNVGAQHAAPLQTSPSSKTFARIDPGSLGVIVRSFKSAATRQINLSRQTPSSPIWQRNYYEQIIRNEKMLNDFRIYIDTNPDHWALDRYYKEIA